MQIHRVSGRGVTVAGRGRGCHTARPLAREFAVRLLRREFSTLMAACDLVVDIGEGDSFTTIYGFKRFFFYWLSKNRVCNAGAPLVLAPQTIGPFDGRLSRWMASRVMHRCEKVFARDDLSRDCLHDLGLADVASDSTDVAFALPYQRIESWRRRCAARGHQRVGPAV